MAAVASVLYYALLLFFIVLLARLVLDYVQVFARSWHPRGVMLVVAEVIYTVTDPPLKALRRVLPPLRLGSMSLDLSFLVLLLMVSLAMGLVQYRSF